MNKTVLALTFSVNVLSSFAYASHPIQMPEEDDRCPLGLTLPSTAGTQETFSLKEQWEPEDEGEENIVTCHRKSIINRTVAKLNLLARKTYTRLSIATEKRSEEALVKHPKFGAIKYQNAEGGVIFTRHPKGYSGKPLFFNPEVKAWYAPGNEGTLELPRDRKSKKVIIMYPGEIAVAFKIKDENNLSPSGNYSGLNEKELCNQALFEIIEREF
jgi:hypothetical protein